MTIKTTIDWWHQAPDLNDNQSESINGGSGFTSISISGGVGDVQINSSDGAQINLGSKHGRLQYRSYRNRHGYSSYYFH